MIVLSGDIGGTHTRMQLTEFTPPNEMNVIKSAHFNNNSYPSFLDIIDVFFTTSQISPDEVISACFGIAGPIINGAVAVTNLSWTIKAIDIKNKLGLEKIVLINDFVSIGYGLEVLQPQDLATLQSGKLREGGLKAYLGAGTGLGVGFMTYHQDTYVVHPTEGGHIDFAPTDEIQLELLKYLRKKYHRVSFERVLSGEGLVNIYRFVRDNKIFGEEENSTLRSLIESHQSVDVAATISEYAVGHKDVVAKRALDIFMRIYGAAVGNLALTILPYGGLYIVGGIAPKLLSQFKIQSFLEAFSDKGRMSPLLKDIPLHVVLYEDIGLQGTAVYARRLVE